MGISLNSLCVDCLLKKHIVGARALGNDDQAYAFTKDIMRHFLESKPEDTSAIMAVRINELYMKHYGLPQDRFTQEKIESNRFVAERLTKIRSIVENAADPVLTALQYAILGNYIDFSALGKTVSFETLEEMLSQPEKFSFDTGDYARFLQELKTAKSLLIFTDNAGEIGFDLVLAETIFARYPELSITFCVRGMPAHNDATREDAAFFQIPFPVIDTGNEIGGVLPELLGDEAKKAFYSSDLILAKGMGNTETLYGCGAPIYYAFLVKCLRFQQVFGKPHMTAMFVKEPSKAQ